MIFLWPKTHLQLDVALNQSIFDRFQHFLAFHNPGKFSKKKAKFDFLSLSYFGTVYNHATFHVLSNTQKSVPKN